MKRISSFLLTLALSVALAIDASGNGFEQAESAYESEDFGACLRALEAIERIDGTSPRLESMRVLCQNHLNQPREAYLSLLAYTKLTDGLDLSENDAHQSLLALKSELLGKLRDEEKKKKEGLQQERMDAANAFAKTVAKQSQQKRHTVAGDSGRRFVQLYNTASDKTDFKTRLSFLAADGSNEILRAVEDNGRSDELLREADQAFNDGLMAKAAKLYSNAYLSMPSRGPIGLKAASLLVNRVKDLGAAAIIWHRVVAFADPESAEKAAEQLQRHATELETLYKKSMETVGSESEPLQLRGLKWLTEVFPEKPRPWVELAIYHAKSQDLTNTMQALAKANKIGFDQPSLKASDFAGLLAGAETGLQFEEFLRDAFGPGLAAAMKSELERIDTARTEARQKAEQEQLAKERTLTQAKRRKTIDQQRSQTIVTINELLKKCSDTLVQRRELRDQVIDFKVAETSIAFDEATRTYAYTWGQVEINYKKNGSVRTWANTATIKGWPMTTVKRIDGEIPLLIHGDYCVSANNEEAKLGRLKIQFNSPVPVKNSLISKFYDDRRSKENSDSTVEFLAIVFSGKSDDYDRLVESFRRLKKLDVEYNSNLP